MPDVLAIASAIACDLARISEILDFIVLSGDLTEDAHPDSFRQFEQLFSGLAPPIYCVPGNHDGPSAYFQWATSSASAQNDISGKVVDLGAARLLGLNTCIEDETTGALAPQDLDLVARELASDTASRLIIVMHHPPFAPGLREFDEIGRLRGAEDLAGLLRGAAAAPVILCGHVHRVYQARWHDAACFVAGSPALPYTSELPFGDTPIHPSTEAVGYFVHAIDADGTHVVTQQPLPGGAAGT